MFYKNGITAAAILLCASAACAQSAGSVLVTAGWLHLAPQTASDPLRVTSVGGTPTNIVRTGTHTNVESADTVGLGINYFITDNIVGEVFAGVPPRHTITGTGTLQKYGELGNVKQWSPALLVKYYFGSATQRFRPYVGAGVNYTWFTNGQLTNSQFAKDNYGPGSSTDVKADASWNPVFTLGASYAITDRWYAGAFVSYLPLQTTAKLTTTTATKTVVTSEANIKIRPIVTYLSVGYRF
ncbi:MAG: OmpW family protein [Ottowia sp.]|nr:OmpW family protein [Ottowia sp.]